MDLSDWQKAANKMRKSTATATATVKPPENYARTDYEVKMPAGPTAGAQQRARNVRVGTRQASRTATGRALASGAYGNTPAAMLGRAADEGDAAIGAQMAGTGILEGDIDRQIDVDTGNQNRAMGVAGLNMSFDQYMRDNDYRNRALDMEWQRYEDRQARIAKLMEEASRAARGSVGSGAMTNSNPVHDRWQLLQQLFQFL